MLAVFPRLSVTTRFYAPQFIGQSFNHEWVKRVLVDICSRLLCKPPGNSPICVYIYERAVPRIRTARIW